MRRKLDRAKSSASNPETNGINSTSPETGTRRSKRSSSNAPAPSKASRLQPTTPLHMTTRAASRAATSSTATSDASADSRRSSLADSTAHIGGFDIDADRPAKRSRLSDRSNQSANEHSSVNTTLLNVKLAARRLKNEDSFDVPSLTVDGDDASARVLSIDGSENGNGNTNHPHGEDEDVNVIRSLKPFPLPRRRGRGRRPKNAQLDLAVESANESFDQRTPARSASRVNGQTVDTDQEQPARVIKRLPGRRRAPNPNISIEADLRRQLQLKMGYRAVAKALKPVLAELAKRTVEELENGSDAHKRTEEYDIVIRELGQRLQSRLDILENEKKLLEEHTERLRKANEETANGQYDDVFLSFQEDYLTTTKRALLNLARDQCGDEDSDATDDEGNFDASGNRICQPVPVKHGVIPPLHDSLSMHHHTGRLDDRYDSRSRIFIETDRYWERDRKRWRTLTVRLKSAEKDPLMEQVSREISNGFGTTDYTRREKSIARFNVLALADAATAVEAEAGKMKEKPQTKVISNDDADALQALALVSEWRFNDADLQGQEQKQISTLAPPPPVAEILQMRWNPISIPSAISPQRQESQPPTVPNNFSYYDPTKSSIQPRERNIPAGREPESAISARGFRTNETDAYFDHSRVQYGQPETLQPREQRFDGYQIQYNLETSPADRATYERPTQPRWTFTQKQHSRTTSWEDDAFRAQRRQMSPEFESKKGTPHLGHQSLEEKWVNETAQLRGPQEAAGADPLTQSAGARSSLPPVQQVEEYDRMGRVALPGQASTYYAPPVSHGTYHATSLPGLAGNTPALSVSIEHSHHRPASEFHNWTSDNEANATRFSYFRPARPMALDEEMATQRERHTPRQMKERRISGEGRKRSETVGEPQITKRPSLALDTAAGSDNRGHGPSTAPVHMSPVPTPTPSAGARQMTPGTLPPRQLPPSEGRMETPPGHNPRNQSLGSVTIDPPHSSYQGYQLSPMQPTYHKQEHSTYGPPPPGYGPVAPSQPPPPPYNVTTSYVGQQPSLPPPPLQPGYGNQPSMLQQQHLPQSLFQPILPNNPPNSVMTPTYSGPQYRGTPIQPANPPTSQGGPSTLPPFGPAFSQISTGGPQTNNGHSTRGGRNRGRGASRNGETAFHHYKGPPGMEQGGKS